MVQLLVEGGSRVAASFHRAGLVDQYVLYLAPALLGGDDGVPLFAGPGAPTMADVWRGRIADVRRLGPDVRIDLLAARGRRCRTVSVMFTGIVEELGTLASTEPAGEGVAGWSSRPRPSPTAPASATRSRSTAAA